MKLQVRVWSVLEAAGLGKGPPPQAGVLTDEHAASSYGQLVLTLGGIAYGPGDLPDAVIELVSEAMTGEWESHDQPAIKAHTQAEERVRASGWGMAFELPQ